MFENTSLLTDEALLALLKQDNELAFNELFNRYWDKMYVAAYKRLQSQEAAEELVQDLFTSIWLHRKSLQIHTFFPAYLAASIKYATLRYLQKETSRKIYQKDTRSIYSMADHSTAENIALLDLQSTLTREVNNLPDKCKTVFELSRYKNYSTREIATELNISEKTVENHIGKALKTLRSSLKDYFTTILITVGFLS